MVQDLYIGQGVTVGLNKNKILEGFARFDGKKNNQLGVGVSGEKDVGEEARVG